jgi:hypothetical protein
MGLLIWATLSAYATRTQPPVDCYERARWDGHKYVMTGEWVCLK